jgi:cytoskeletal protein CcmA (bactofilin family)
MNQDIESMFNGTVQETADARDAVSDVISENSKLNGDFESSGNIEIRGTVMGNVVIDGMLVLHGAHVDGNVKAKMVYMSKGSVNGSIVADSVVDIDGTVGGSVDGDKVIVRKDSVVSGQYIHCQSIAVETGAQIDCSVKTGYIPSIKDDALPALDSIPAETASPVDAPNVSSVIDELIAPTPVVKKKTAEKSAPVKDEFAASFGVNDATDVDDSSGFLADDVLKAING